MLQWGDVSELPARRIYEEVLPEVVSRLTYDLVPYHRGSPYGGEGWDTADPTVGDIHQWDVWAGAGRNYQDYDLLGGRFVRCVGSHIQKFAFTPPIADVLSRDSEFGVPAMPSIRTIDHWLQRDMGQRYSRSPLMAQHNKAGSHERRFAILVNENFKSASDLERYATYKRLCHCTLPNELNLRMTPYSHTYITQLMQAEALGCAYRSWRREWRGKGKEYVIPNFTYGLSPKIDSCFQTSGALVWQLNDCWPVTSWSLIDYFV